MQCIVIEKWTKFDTSFGSLALPGWAAAGRGSYDCDLATILQARGAHNIKPHF